MRDEQGKRLQSLFSVLDTVGVCPVAFEFDEDSPELMDEELAQFYRVSENRREERRKQTTAGA